MVGIGFPFFRRGVKVIFILSKAQPFRLVIYLSSRILFPAKLKGGMYGHPFLWQRTGTSPTNYVFASFFDSIVLLL